MIEFDKIIKWANVTWGGIACVLTTIFGEQWILLFMFLILNIIDYITGIIKANLTKKANSVKGLEGILKKLSYWIAIATAFIVSLVLAKIGKSIGYDLSFSYAFGWFTVATFLINELRSIIENLVAVGVPCPQFLINGLEIAQKLIDKKTSGGDEK